MHVLKATGFSANEKLKMKKKSKRDHRTISVSSRAPLLSFSFRRVAPLLRGVCVGRKVFHSAAKVRYRISSEARGEGYEGGGGGGRLRFILALAANGECWRLRATRTYQFK